MPLDFFILFYFRDTQILFMQNSLETYFSGEGVGDENEYDKKVL